MTRQEKGDLFNTGDCLIEMNTWAGYHIHYSTPFHIVSLCCTMGEIC